MSTSSANQSYTSTDKAPSSPARASSYKMPGLGKTRCYWAIMDSSMNFRYLDPVLQAHMHEQAPLVIGKNLVDFIHPHEKQAAADDFAKFKSSTTIFGSVTRCRYARVSYARRVLGAEQPETDPDAHLKCIDDEWVAARIVASLIAENTVLVFFHATQDVDEAKDSDDTKYSDWTNWCGPRVTDISNEYFTPAQQELLNSAFVACQAEAEPIKDEQSGDVSVTDGTTLGGGQLAYVFQLLNSSTGDILYTWPPTTPTGVEKDLTLHGPVEEGQERYIPADYANLARAVLDKRREKTVNEAKTSCTKRFQSRHPILNDGNIGNIESVVVTYQAIAFVCFQTGNGYLNSKTVAPMPGSNSLAGLKRKSDHSHHDELDADEVIKRLKAAGGTTAPWVHDANGNPVMLPGLDGSWNPDASAPYYADGSYPNMYSSVFGQGDVLGGNGMPTIMTGPYHNPQDPNDNSANEKYIARAKGEKSAQAALLNPKPVVVHKVRKADKGRVCTSCGTANSPEWRKGPSGIKTLCNACGLRFARSQARKLKKAKARVAAEKAAADAAAAGIADPNMSHSAQPHIAAEAYGSSVAGLGPMSAPLPTDAHEPPSPYMGLGNGFTNPHSAPLPPLPQGGASGSNAASTSYGNTYGAFVNYSPFDNNDWSPASNHSFSAQQNSSR